MDVIGRRPVLVALLGAACIAWSAPLVRLAEVPPATAAVGRCRAPDAEAVAWLVLLALSSQVLGWLLISSSLPRLPAALTSVLLLAQPLGSLAISGLVLGEAPTPVQYAGAACILIGVVMASATRRAPTAEPREPVAP